jgi:hypothetical protein
MKKKTYSYLFIAPMIFIVTNIQAQKNNFLTPTGIHPSARHYVPLAGVVDLINVKSNFNPVLQSIEIEDQSNKTPSDTSLVMMPRQDTNFQEDLPEGAENKTSSLDLPNIISQFNGFSDNQYTPPDDNIAVSNGGYVVSAINSIYRIFKPSNSTIQLKSSSFNDALKSALPNITDTYFDPRVIYDAEADRFIIVVLNGTISSASYIVVMFSKDNNPADGWNVYSFSGDVFSKSNWADYDNIGISKGDLFITDNLFDDNQNYIEPSIIQINKDSGYNGKTMAYKTWEPMTNFSVQPTLFTLVPASHGLGGDYGDTMFFVSNKFQGGKTLTLLEIDGKESSSVSNLSTSTISYGTLTTASPKKIGGLQLGQVTTKRNGYTLNEGDTRIKQAFYLNGNIFDVFTTRDQTTGFSDIVYSKINLAKNSLVYKQLGLTNFDYVYPSLASFVNEGQDSSVVIGYCRTGKSIYPEVDIVKCDSSLTFSESVTVESGRTAVIGSDSIQRWGDYTGMARQYNGKNCYFAGSFGTGGAYQTEIAEIGSKSLGILESQPANEKNVTVFPNPVTDIYTLKFELEHKSHINISLINMAGKLVTLLYDGTPPVGDQKFSFNKAGLAPGIYSLVISDDSTALITKKIVVQGSR